MKTEKNILPIYLVKAILGYTALIEDKNYDDSAVVLEEADIMYHLVEDFMQMCV